MPRWRYKGATLPSISVRDLATLRVERLTIGSGSGAHCAQGPGPARSATTRWTGRVDTASSRDSTGHHFGVSPLTRTRGLRPLGCRSEKKDRQGLLGTQERHLRVLVTRGMRAALG